MQVKEIEECMQKLKIKELPKESLIDLVVDNTKEEEDNTQIDLEIDKSLDGDSLGLKRRRDKT